MFKPSKFCKALKSLMADAVPRFLCIQIIEFVDDIIERRQQEIAEEHGYELVDHALVLYVRPRGSDVTRQDSGPTNRK